MVVRQVGFAFRAVHDKTVDCVRILRRQFDRRRESGTAQPHDTGFPHGSTDILRSQVFGRSACHIGSHGGRIEHIGGCRIKPRVDPLGFGIRLQYDTGNRLAACRGPRLQCPHGTGKCTVYRGRHKAPRLRQLLSGAHPVPDRNHGHRRRPDVLGERVHRLPCPGGHKQADGRGCRERFSVRRVNTVSECPCFHDLCMQFLSDVVFF